MRDRCDALSGDEAFYNVLRRESYESFFFCFFFKSLFLLILYIISVNRITASLVSL